jgi:glutaredoxin 2
MKAHLVLLTTIAALNLAACASAEDKKDEAQAAYTEEKTETVQQYKECVKDADGVAEKIAQCEPLLKAIGAMEGSAAPATPAQ